MSSVKSRIVCCLAGSTAFIFHLVLANRLGAITYYMPVVVTDDDQDLLDVAHKPRRRPTDGPGAAGMPPDAQAKASQMAGMAGPVKSVGANPVPVTLAVVNNEKEAVGFSEGVAQAASPASSPSVPMLCSIFSSQVWRAAGLEPKAVGTR